MQSTTILLRVGISPWLKSNPDCYQSNKCYPGEEIEILDTIAKIINASLIFKITDIPGCGNRGDNGTWLGLMAMLEANEIDITGNLCDVGLARTNQTFANYSYPVVRIKDSYLIKVPDKHLLVPHILGPFKPWLWNTILIITAIFITLKVVTDTFSRKIKFSTSFKTCLSEILTVTFSMDGPEITVTWMVWISFIGSVALLYATYIKGALMQPIVTSPFFTNELLAENLYDGDYKLLDYNKVGHYKCYTDEACEKMSEGIITHGFHYFEEPKNFTAKQGEHPLLNELWENDNLVLFKPSYTMKMYLNDYKNRDNLWLLEDKKSPAAFLSFYYRQDLPQGKLIDKIIEMIGDYPENLHNRRNGLWRSVVQNKVIKPIMNDTDKISLTEIWSFLQFYVVVNCLCGIVLMAEIILKRLNNYDCKIDT